MRFGGNHKTTLTEKVVVIEQSKGVDGGVLVIYSLYKEYINITMNPSLSV